MRQRGTGWMLGVCLALLVISEAVAKTPQEEQERVRLARLEALGKLWGQVRYRHPWMLTRRLDWDAAFMAAVPKVEAAKSTEAYAAAVQSMLDVLKDPATKVKREEAKAPPSPPTLRPLMGWEKDVLVLDLRNLATPDGAQKFWGSMPRIQEEVAKARAVIVDLRMRGFEESEVWGVSFMADRLLPQLVEGELVVPGLRGVIHSGLRTQSTNIYSTAFSSEASVLLQGTPGKKPARLVFLFDEHSYLDPKALALRAAGRALLIAEGPVTDVLTVDTQEVSLGEKLKATVRTSELSLPLAFDAQLPARADLKGPDAAFTRALALAHQKGKPKASAVTPQAEPLWRPDAPYPEAQYPSRELRLLSAVRLWNVVRFFFAYTHLMEVDWSSRLPVLLKRFEAAKDGKEYALAVAEAAAELRDSHVHVSGHPAYDGLLSGTGAPFDVQDVEGKVVVTSFYDAELAPGLAVGDVIEKVDGEPVEERIRRFARYDIGSTEAATRDNLMALALMGPPRVDSTATLTVRGAKGVREVKVTRSMAAFRKERPHEPYKMLEGNIGYVNLAQLEPGEVAEMFQKFQGTRGIVFDLRGYPRGTGGVLAPYLNVKGAKTWASFEVPLVAGSGMLHGRAVTKQEIPTADVPLYRGRTVTLINERAISQAEHVGMMLEVTCGTTFVGSPTVGANGNVTYAVLPGGIRMSFTGLDTRHADGRQLQRKGLIPHVSVRPTLAGLRAGRDEVLERALQLLKEEPKPAPGRAAPSATRRE